MFDDAALLPGGQATDIQFAHPENLGLGIANSSLCGGRLLLATDVVFKRHSDAEFLKEIYNDQWVYQFGAQYRLNYRVRLRTGYAYNENPMRDAQLTSVGGVALPDGVPGLRYVQGQFASIAQHRITAGVGVQDVLPGIDFDLFAGGMFRNEDQFADTQVALQGYWLGAGIAWRFGRGACERLPVVSDWGSSGCCN